MTRSMNALISCAALAAAVVALPASAHAQQMEIDRAVMAAPGNAGDDATVLSFNADGSVDVIREGSNGWICFDSANYDERFTAMCTSEANRARLEQTHRVRMTSANDEEASARFQELEASGERAQPHFGTFMFRVVGDDPATAGRHTTIFVPGATAESLGLPDGRDPAGLGLMQGGTSSAHLMLPRGM